jgi:hypothetical protein
MQNYSQLMEQMGVFHGEVFTPEWALEAPLDNTLRSLVTASYGLVGFMTPEMKKSLDRDPQKAAWRFTGYETSNKQTYFVVTLQSGRFQTRFVMHLADPLVQNMVRWSGTKGHLKVVIGVKDMPGISYFEPEFSAGNVAPLLKLGDEAEPASGMELMVDMANISAELKKRTDILECGDIGKVDSVAVNTIIWTDGMKSLNFVEREAAMLH